MEKPSVPLKATGDPGPPKIVEVQEKYSAVEGNFTGKYSADFGNFTGKIQCR